MSGLGRAAVFIDRDGTVVRDAHYIAGADQVDLIPGAAAAIRRLRSAGLPVVLVTNQSGIARGLYTEAQYHAVAARVVELLGAEGAEVDATYYCPHHPDHTGPCDCRKPAAGLYRQAAREHGLDPGRSYYVGDKLTDVLPAAALGGQGVLVRTGYGAAAEATLPSGFWVADDLGGAAELILREQRLRSVYEG